MMMIDAIETIYERRTGSPITKVLTQDLAYTEWTSAVATVETEHFPEVEHDKPLYTVVLARQRKNPYCCCPRLTEYHAITGLAEVMCSCNCKIGYEAFYFGQWEDVNEITMQDDLGMVQEFYSRTKWECRRARHREPTLMHLLMTGIKLQYVDVLGRVPKVDLQAIYFGQFEDDENEIRMREELRDMTSDVLARQPRVDLLFL